MATYKSKTAETRTGAMANWGWSTGTSGYDDEDRLVSWTRDDNNLSQSWTLTKEGDWSQFVENTTTENRTHGPAHELTAIGSTALSYDPKGNLTVDNTKNHKYTWDFDNRMSAADTDGDNVDEVTLKYDALGRRVSKTSGSATVVYVSMTQPIQYSPLAGQVVAEYASGAAPASPIEKYVYASYIDEPVLKDGTGGTVYYHRNSQYSVAALTSTTGAVVERYAYEPYGELTILAADGSTVRASSSYANTYTYTGRRWDADLSLYYFRARYYDPKLGRFVGRDPAGYVDGGSLSSAVFARAGGLDASGNGFVLIPSLGTVVVVGSVVVTVVVISVAIRVAYCSRKWRQCQRDGLTWTADCLNKPYNQGLSGVAKATCFFLHKATYETICEVAFRNCVFSLRAFQREGFGKCFDCSGLEESGGGDDPPDDPPWDKDPQPGEAITEPVPATMSL